MRRSGWFVAALIIVLMTSAACNSGTDDDEHYGTLPPTPPATAGDPSPTPLATPSTQPPDDLAAAITVAKQYYAESNRALNTGDTSGLRRLTTSDCPCLKFAEYIKLSWQAGSIKAPNYYSITGYRNAKLMGIYGAQLIIQFDVAEEIDYNKSGKIIARIPQEKGLEHVMNLIKINKIWKVSNVSQLQ